MTTRKSKVKSEYLYVVGYDVGSNMTLTSEIVFTLPGAQRNAEEVIADGSNEELTIYKLVPYLKVIPASIKFEPIK